jgi:hypothetical protein
MSCILFDVLNISMCNATVVRTLLATIYANILILVRSTIIYFEISLKYFQLGGRKLLEID